MTGSLLVEEDNEDYTFAIDETNIKTDLGPQTSTMDGNTDGVDNVSATVDVQVQKLVVTGPASVGAGTSNNQLTVTAKDEHDNIDKDYGPADLTFNGLSSVTTHDGTDYIPEITGAEFNSTVTSVNFTDGISDTDELNLTAYVAESASIDVTDTAVPPNSSSGADDDLDIVVAHASANYLTAEVTNPDPDGVDIKVGVQFRLASITQTSRLIIA